MTQPTSPSPEPIPPQTEQLPIEVTGVVHVDSMPDSVLPEWLQWLSGLVIPLGAAATTIGLLFVLGSARRDRKRFGLEMRHRHEEMSALRSEQARLLRLSDKVNLSGNAAPNEYVLAVVNSSQGPFFDISIRVPEQYGIALTSFSGEPQGELEFDELFPGVSKELVLVRKKGCEVDPAREKPIPEVLYTDEHGIRWVRKPRCQPELEMCETTPDERSFIARIGDATKAASGAFFRT